MGLFGPVIDWNWAIFGQYLHRQYRHQMPLWIQSKKDSPQENRLSQCTAICIKLT